MISRSLTEPANAWRISRAARSIGTAFLLIPTFKIGTISSTRSGVRLHALVGRHHAGGTR
jgi:hypothetical protein